MQIARDTIHNKNIYGARYARKGRRTMATERREMRRAVRKVNKKMAERYDVFSWSDAVPGIFIFLILFSIAICIAIEMAG